MNDREDPQITLTNLSQPHPHKDAIRSAFERALAGDGKLPDAVFAVVGFSGRKIRLFINNLVEALDQPAYLEIGVFGGASLISALYGNAARVLGIDDWSWSRELRASFFKALSELSTDGNAISLLNSDFRKINYEGLGQFDIMFYDGSHSAEDQFDGVKMPQPCLRSEYTLIVDDWNWDHVRNSTFDALRDIGASIEMCIEIRTTLDNTLAKFAGASSDWHNGLFVGAIRVVRD